MILWHNTPMTLSSNAGFSRSAFLIVILAVAGVALGFVAGKIMDKKSSHQARVDIPGATVLPQPRPLGAFEFTDHQGKPFTPQQLLGKWTFVFFGYTHCPDVCPNTLTLFNVVANTLEMDPQTAGKTRFMLVSVDPERDTPETLATYMAYFNKSFVGITGSHQQLQNLTGKLGAVYMPVQDKASPNNYEVDHSASILLLSPQGEFHAVFSTPHDAKIISDAFRSILKITGG